MNISLGKIIMSAVFLTFITPQVIFAQTSNNAGNTNTTNTTSAPPRAILIDETTLQPVQVNTNNQAGAALDGTGTSGSASISSKTAASSLGTCVGASGITSFVQTQIGSLVGSIASSEVPTADNAVRGKETGTLTSGYISWDSLGYCAINSIIEAIGAATVNWINSGFQGNPVFVDNPEQFFADIADIEAGRFLNDISNGFLCTPIKDIVRVNLATQYNKSINPSKGQCTFSGVAGNLDQFVSGETFSWQDWFSYTQNPSNNPFGATIYGSIELDQRLAQSLGTQTKLLDWGRGFLSFEDPETGKVKSPGAVIEGQINQRLFNGESRINIADEFDEVVTALVNQLVKVAINEVTSSGN